MKFEDAFFRIQDARYQLPTKSTNWRAYDSDEHMNGVSAFIDLMSATKDLLGHQSADGWSNVYSEAVIESGGQPTLSIFTGDIVEEDVGAGVVVKPNYKTERRFATRNLWAAWIRALASEFKEDANKLARWPRTPNGFEDLKQQYDLDDFQEDVFRALWRHRRR